MGELYSMTAGVQKQSFKCGSLDQLMKLNDDFQKMETMVDSSCKRVEKQYTELVGELNMPVDLKVKLVRGPGNQYQDVQIEEYLKNFQWDSVQYQYDKTLEYLGMKV